MAVAVCGDVVVDAPVCCGVTALRNGLVLEAGFGEAAVVLECSSGDKKGLCDVDVPV